MEIPAALSALFGLLIAFAVAGLVSSCAVKLREWRQRRAATRTTRR